MLAKADRGLFIYEPFKLGRETGAELLWHVKGKPVLPVYEEHVDGSYPSAASADRKQRSRNMDPIPERVIEYTVTIGKDIGDLRLITTIFGPADVPAPDLAEAYVQCRGDQIVFR